MTCGEVLEILVHGYDAESFGFGEAPDFRVRDRAKAKLPHMVGFHTVRRQVGGKGLGQLVVDQEFQAARRIT